MKYTLLDKRSCPQLLSRIDKLSPDKIPLWGKMSVTDMMFHCAIIHEQILKGTEHKRKATLKQKLLRIFVLRALKRFPKGIQTNKKYIRPVEDDSGFEIHKNHLISSVNQVASHVGEIQGNHPFLGPLDTMKWRRFIFMHLDYHLQQFDV